LILKSSQNGGGKSENENFQSREFRIESGGISQSCKSKSKEDDFKKAGFQAIKPSKMKNSKN
jgi:hypothetical protein